ncbi:MAG: hypothetical protein EH225_04285 [Calditrichaeota bacterium]|nr:phosphotransferase [Calditrichota bacterium]RQW05803.1 MAG: hypothetical protein EH225_04285 [Calditrichota bacterium]
MRSGFKKNRYFLDVPEPEGADWLSLNGIRLWLPPGKSLSLHKMSLSISELSLDFFAPGWLIVSQALNFILKYLFGTTDKYRVDRITKIGYGLSKVVYRADIIIYSKREQHLVFAVSLLSGEANREAWKRMVREFYLLNSLQKNNPSFSVPEPLAILWVNGGMLSLRTFVTGYSLKFQLPRFCMDLPWEIVAQIAAEIHNIQNVDLPDEMEYYATRREHVLACVSKYQKYRVSQIQDCLEWISANLPPEDNSCLIHGDLLNQNIYVSEGNGVSVLDWEYSFCGDPAYDLAIVTRGKKKPFGVTGGKGYLIDSYLEAGGKKLSEKDVIIYELFLILGWYEQSLDRSTGGHAPEHYLQKLGNMLRRVC